MLPEINHLSVNWQDGMKVKTQHFIAFDNYVKDLVRDVLGLQLNENNYGLLPGTNDTSSSLHLKSEIVSDNKLKVTLLSCRAVTAGGVRIERRKEEHTVAGMKRIECIYSLAGNTATTLDVIVSVDLFAREKVDEPDPQEMPPRRPWVVPKYTLKVLQHGNPVNAISEVKIGEFVFNEGLVAISEAYIPPCSTMTCYPPLTEIYEKYAAILNEMEAGAVRVNRMFRDGKIPHVEDRTVIRQSLEFFIQQIASFLSKNYEWHRRILPSSSPLFFVEFYIRFARILQTTLFRYMRDAERDHLLNSFKTLAPGFEQSWFETALNEAIELQYDHTNIRQAIHKIETFVIPVNTIITELAKRDPESISVVDNKHGGFTTHRESIK